MTDADLQALRAENAERRKRKEAATAGPWVADSCVDEAWVETGDAAPDHGTTGIAQLPTDEYHSPFEQQVANATFIAATRNDPVEDRIDSLLAEVERLNNALNGRY